MFEQFLDLLCWLFPPEIFGMMKKAKAAMTWREKLHQEFALCAFLSKYSSSSSNFIVFFFTAGSYNTSNEGSRFCYLPSKRKWSFLDMSKGEAEEANASLLQKRCERKLVSPKWKQINVSVNPFSSQEDHLGSFSKTREVFGWEYPPRIADHGLLFFNFEEALLQFNPHIFSISYRPNYNVKSSQHTNTPLKVAINVFLSPKMMIYSEFSGMSRNLNLFFAFRA